MKTTLADLALTAQAAANEAYSAKELFERTNIKLDKFRAAGHESGDFPVWENLFNAQLEMLGHYSAQPSPATIEAAKAAAKAAGLGKTLVTLLLCVLCVSAFVPSARAGLFGSVTVLTNMTSGPVLQGFQLQPFTVTMQAQSMTMLITNINTNHTYTLSYFGQQYGMTTTNQFPLATLVTNFNASLGFTNGGNAYVPIPLTYFTLTNILWGTFSNSAWAAGYWTNGVQIQ